MWLMSVAKPTYTKALWGPTRFCGVMPPPLTSLHPGASSALALSCFHLRMLTASFSGQSSPFFLLFLLLPVRFLFWVLTSELEEMRLSELAS